ncbi:unnamed protein product [Prorocentrum cordatum]|uniref:Selenoprotein O n=1 Tax=Prorocentrum cordatum TaxID=2364126 RepID=A0ABN9QBY3_9DINO|nr:unnamed protein product [Polarella glacialis]
MSFDRCCWRKLEANCSNNSSHPFLLYLLAMAAGFREQAVLEVAMRAQDEWRTFSVAERDEGCQKWKVEVAIPGVTGAFYVNNDALEEFEGRIVATGNPPIDLMTYQGRAAYESIPAFFSRNLNKANASTAFDSLLFKGETPLAAASRCHEVFLERNPIHQDDQTPCFQSLSAFLRRPDLNYQILIKTYIRENRAAAEEALRPFVNWGIYDQGGPITGLDFHGGGAPLLWKQLFSERVPLTLRNAVDLAGEIAVDREEQESIAEEDVEALRACMGGRSEEDEEDAD